MQQNFRGRGEELGGLIQLGYSKRAGILYDVPYASPGGKTGVSVYAGYDQQHEVTTGTSENRRVFYTGNTGNTREHWQIRLGLTQRHQVITTQTLSAAYKYYHVQPQVVDQNPTYLSSDSLESIRYAELTYFLKHDKRDYKHYPLKGHYADLFIRQSGLNLARDLYLTTFEAALRKFVHLKGRFYAAAGIAGKATVQEYIPYVLQEGLGYSNNLRGYEYYVIDGNHYVLGKSNLKFELVPRKTHDLKFIKNPRFNKFYYAFYLNLFADAGYVQNNFSASQNPLSNQWLYSYGLGLDFLTYYDTVVRFELSVNKQRESGFFLHFTQPI